MKRQFYRTSLLIGEDGVDRLNNSRVILFGVGGVGSFCAEALIRSGVGFLTIVDKDRIDVTNLNRQLQTLEGNVGESKVLELSSRLKEINGDAHIEAIEKVYSSDNRDEFNLSSYDYIVDAIDTISAKIDLASYGYENSIPVISSMGAGNKLDPTSFKVDDIYRTSVDPIAKVMRRELKKRRVGSLKVVYSLEAPIKLDIKSDSKEKIIGSVAFVPSVVGLIMAGEVVKDLGSKD